MTDSTVNLRNGPKVNKAYHIKLFKKTIYTSDTLGLTS